MSRVGFYLLSVTAIVWILEVVVFWLVAEAVNIDVTFVEGMFVVVLTSFVMSIPAAPGYVGTFDAALLFALVGLRRRRGSGACLHSSWRFVLFVPITIAGLILMFTRYGGFPSRSTTDATPTEESAPVSTISPR